MSEETFERRPETEPHAAEPRDPPDAGPDEDAVSFTQEAAEAAAAQALRGLTDEARGGEELPLTVEELKALSEEEQTVDEQALEQSGDEESLDGLEAIAPAEIGAPELEEEAPSAEKVVAKAKKLSAEQVRHVLHALLFVADKPLTTEQLKVATGLEGRRITKALEKLAGELREGVSGVVLSEVGGGYQLRTAPEAAEYVRRFLQIKPRRLTRAALETLAIIAYRQPVTRPEVEEIRGVDCGAVMKALLDWKMLKILGKKDEVGRPILYGTTREFLEFFQLPDLASLPTLREFQELNEESRQIVEEELGPEAVAGIEGTVAQLSDPSYLEAEAARVAASEAALAELEQAMADTEKAAGAVAATISPNKAKPVAEESTTAESHEAT